MDTEEMNKGGGTNVSKTVNALDSLAFSCRIIDFSDAQKALLEETAGNVDADASLSSRYRRDCLALGTHDDPAGARNPLQDPAHPAHALSREGQALYPALVLLSAVEPLEEAYRRAGISGQVLADTLSDIPLWMDNCRAHFGYQGMLEYEWLSNHMRMRLFRLGRLEYIHTRSRVPAYFYRAKADGRLFVFLQEGMKLDADGALSADGVPAVFLDDGSVVRGHMVDPLGAVCTDMCAVERAGLEQVLCPGDPVLDVHIPEGPPMCPEGITESLDGVPAFFREHCGVTDIRAFTCGSWLMAPGLSQIIPGSNIARFQQRFYRVPYTTRDNQVFERVFGKECTDWTQCAMNSRLQKGVCAWYRRGGNLRQMQGVILLG